MIIIIKEVLSMQVIKTLKFKTVLQRFCELRKIKKQHQDLKILEKGFTEVGWDNGYFWAKVQYES